MALRTVGWSVLLATGVALLPGLQMGIAIGVLNPLEAALTDYFGVSSVSPFGWPLAVALFNPAGFLGTQLASQLSSHFGRKGLIMSSSILFIASGLLFAISSGPFAATRGEFSSFHFLCFLLARILVGVGCGAASVLTPVYIDEISPNHVRGLLGSTFQLSIVIGILVGQAAAFSLSDPGSQWGLLLGFTSSLGVVQLLLSPVVLIESPAWLMAHGHDQSTVLTSIRMLHATKGLSAVSETIIDLESSQRNLQLDDDVIQERLQELTLRRGEINDGNRLNVRQAFQDKSFRLPIILLVSLMLAQQLSGINAVFYYSTEIFRAAGLESPALGTLLASTVNVIATLATMPLIESWGRRKLVLLGVSGMLGSSILMTVAMSLGREDPSSMLSQTLVMAVLAYVSFFEIGLGAIPWVIGNEIFPSNVKDGVIGFAAGLNWFANFGIGLGYPYLRETLGVWSFIPFTGALGIALLFFQQLLPETKGRDPQDVIQLINNGKTSPVLRMFDFKRDD